MKYTDPPHFKLFDFKLNNIEEFIEGDFPEINPVLDEKRYRDLWEGVLYKCMNGMWGRDYDKKKDIGGYRYMPNDLYHYKNIFYIAKEELGVGSELLHPSLRDFDWFVTYNFMIMEGFSGMSEDKKNTCHAFALNFKSYKDITGSNKKLLDVYADDILDKYGKFKNYVNPRDYLYNTHKEPVGIPLNQNVFSNMIWYAGRRLGKSYHLINKHQRGMVTNNAKTVQDYYRGKTKYIGIMGSWDSTYVDEHYNKFMASYNELANLGAYHKDGIDYEGALWIPLTGAKEVGNATTNLNKELGGKLDVGHGSQIHKFTFGGSISAAVGVASNFAAMDEIGVWDDLEGVQALTEPTQERETKIGTQIYAGTGGEVLKALKSRQAFLNPSRIKALGFPDLCNPSNEKEIGLFTPDVYRKDLYRDENGNTDTVLAHKELCIERHDMYKKGLEPYIKHISNYPLVYDDIFMQSSSSIIPVDRALEKLGKITNIPVDKRPSTYAIGKMKREVGTRNVDFITVKNILPITNYDTLKTASDEQKKGICLMYEPPEKDSRYVTTYDTVKEITGTSMCIAATWKYYGKGGVRFNLVCESIFRFRRPSENDDVAINQALYYGGKLCPETNLPHIITYVEDLGFTDIFEKTPYLAIGMLIKNPTTKYPWGVYMSGEMKQKTPGVITELLIASVNTKDVKDGVKEDVLMIDEIESEFLLNEIVYWNPEGNFDFIINLYIFALLIKEWGLRKMLEEPEEGNDLLKKLTEALEQETVEMPYEDVYNY